MSILNSAIQVNHLTLKNRLVMPPMAVAKAAPDGAVTDELRAYYADKARGGYIGLVITEHSYIRADGKAGKGQLSITSDSCIAGLRTLTDTIHSCGSKVFAQLNHAGSAAPTQLTGLPQLSASALAHPAAKDGALPAEMSHSDIEKLIADFAAAALRAKQAGYDGVELHSAHGYLLNQFYSPLTNKRSDEYSGSTLEGRLRLHLQVIEAVRAAVGADYPLALRLGACDYAEGGATIADSVAAAKMLEAAGVDLLDISGGFCFYTHPSKRGQGYFSEISEAVKAAVSVPVILTGGITDPHSAESLLEEKKADLIGVGRAILRDSSWAEKAITALA